MKKRKGFTFAEVLITLVVIGIIATMTIPTAIQSQQDKDTIAKLKRTQSILSQALALSKIYNGEFSTWSMQDNSNESVKNTFKEYIMPYLKTLKVCYNTTGCWTSSLTKSFKGNSNASGASTYGLGTNVTTFILADGTFISMDIWGNSIETAYGVTENLFYPTIAFAADLNGDKGPNQIGKDVFNFVLTKGGIVPAGKDNGGAMCTSSANSGYAGFDCAAKVIKTNSTKY